MLSALIVCFIECRNAALLNWTQNLAEKWGKTNIVYIYITCAENNEFSNQFHASSSVVAFASFDVIKIIPGRGKPFSDDEFLEQACLSRAPNPSQDKMLQRIEDTRSSRNTVKGTPTSNSIIFIFLCVFFSLPRWKYRHHIFMPFNRHSSFVKDNEVSKNSPNLADLSGTVTELDICSAAMNGCSVAHIHIYK
jgi:hypothetical protein